MRRLAVALAVLLLLALVVLAGIVGIGLLADDTPTAADEIVKPELGEATVIRTDLIERESFEGVLQFVDVATVTGQIAGVVTDLPDETSVLERGSVAIEVDGLPIVVFYGARPGWRPLFDGVDAGSDVLQLEQNLETLGYAATAELEDWAPDDEFDADTATMVEAWREDVGLPEGDDVALGRLLYVEGPVRVGELLVAEGSLVTLGTPLFMTSGTSKEVVVELPVDQRDLATAGDAVTIELPDDETTMGTIGSISNLVTTAGGPGGPEVVEVTIALADPAVAGALDRAPVTIQLESDRVSDALAVPVNALLALSEGGYALQVVEDGERRLVPVEIGTFVDSLVEVTGSISEGQTILVPK